MAAGTVQCLGQEPNQGFVSRRVDGRGHHFDLQFISQRLADLIHRRSRLQLDRKQYAIRLRSQESRQLRLHHADNCCSPNMIRSPRVQSQQNMSNSNGSWLRVLPNLLWAGFFGLYIVGCTSEHPQQMHQPPATNDVQAAVATIPPRPKTGDDRLTLAAGQAPAPFEGEGWTDLFDGQSLKGWRVTDFAGHGDVECRAGLMVLNTGDPFTGVNWTNDFPKTNYEVALDAMRVSGSDFFCGLTVPVGESFCSLIVGGWGGSLLGISSLDGMDASENETSRYVNFENGRWYRIRLRITEGRIEAWLDKDKMIDVVTTDRRISLRPGEIEMSKPFGLASWETAAALRQIKMQPVTGPADPPKKHHF